MLSTYISVFNVITAVAFTLMWVDDRRHWYLLHWGTAFFMASINQYAAYALVDMPAPAFNVYSFIYVFSGALFCATLILGAQYFREKRVVLPWRIALLVAASALWWCLVGTVNFERSHLLLSVFLFATYIRVACLLWSAVFICRVASIFFVVKACFTIGVAWTESSALEWYGSDVALGISAILAILNALLLSLISVKKIGADLKRNIQFLNIFHSVTASIHAVNSERELGERILTHLLDQPFWRAGVLMKLTEDGEYLEAIEERGNDGGLRQDLKLYKIPLVGTLSEGVINTGRLVVATDKAVDVAKINSTARSFYQYLRPNNRTHIIIPVSNQGKAVGIMALTDFNARGLLPQEEETLTSIGEVIGFAFENIKRLETLNYRASHDVLTGLGNRAKLHDHCQRVLASSPFTLMLFDLDSFKEVNDVYGHAVGDVLLQALAERLTQALSAKARLFRLGGDEFVVIYPDTVQHRAEAAAEALLELIKLPVSEGKLWLQCGASIGVVETRLVGNDSHELLRCADLAMYKAKYSDTSIAYYDKAYDASVRERIQLLADVDNALYSREFELFYQPVMDLQNNDCAVCEGLLRWHHPTRGLLSAAEFIPIIETTGYLTAVTHRVIELALQDLAKWRRQGLEVSVAINLSASNFLAPSLVDFLIDTARAYDVPAPLLQLEITETVLMKDPQMAEQITARLYQAGFKIILDDFGTGYSSLAYLARFPISIVKIDQSFVGKMGGDKHSMKIVEAIIDLTHKLGFLVAAEGVENQQTALQLKALHCDFAQGFLYSKAVKKSEFDLWYQQNMSDSV